MTGCVAKRNCVYSIIKNAVRWACPVKKNVTNDYPEFMPLEKQALHNKNESDSSALIFVILIKSLS